MSRALHVDRCPDCNEVPKEGGSGILRCACNVRWERGRGVRGTEAEDGLLTNAGLGRQDCPGDVYYVSQLGEIIYLFSNNEWGCDPAPPMDCSSLEDYPAWRNRKLAQVP